ncbi:Protein HIRA-like protein, partial [Dinothrombium tinctorium]
IDNSVIVWNTSICWVPVGKYIASQSDDKTLKIWRTNDWKEEVSIIESFAGCGGTTHVLRLSWSPDGQYLVFAHTMNNRGSTSQIVERDGWKNKKISSVIERLLHLTTLRRPLVVHDLFNSLLDISWSHCGQKLVAHSWDGNEEVNNNGNADSGLKMNICDSRSSTSSRLMKGPTDKQIETRMPDDRRRITPLYIPLPTDNDGIPIPFNVQQTTFSSSSEAKTKIVIERHDDGITPQLLHHKLNQI